MQKVSFRIHNSSSFARKMIAYLEYLESKLHVDLVIRIDSEK